MNVEQVLRDPYTKKLINFKSKTLSRKPGFNRSDIDDIKSNFHRRIIERWPKFNPERACWKTYLDRCLRSSLVDQWRARNAKMRSPDREEFSINETVTDTDGRRVQRYSTMHELSHDPRRDLDRRMDLRHAFEQLTGRLREFALATLDADYCDVARQMNLDKEVKLSFLEQIGEHLRQLGLAPGN